MELDELIRALGAEVVGPFSKVASALAAIEREPVFGAVLDIRLDGETTFPIIDVFVERADPILLVSGGAAFDWACGGIGPTDAMLFDQVPHLGQGRELHAAF